MRHGPARPSSLLLASALAALLAACAPSVAPPASGQASAAVGGSGPVQTAAATASPGLPVAATETAYGTLALRTLKEAQCTADLSVYAQQLGDSPPKALPAQTANGDGIVRWTYDAPRIPSGTARFTATCTSGPLKGSVTGTFSVDRPAMVATALTVRVTADTPPDVLVNTVPSLVPLRDSAIVRMKSTLAGEWKNATRGLGGLQVVDRSADITVFVAAAHGTSVNRQSNDGSEDIVVYVEGELGQKSVENAVATALHEIGHIWCCRGPEADEGGHWKVKERDPGLYGVDKYGLMTDPVTCVTFGSVLSCPNRFSDREMVALGFATFPPPAPDPCITQSLSLRSQIKSLERQLLALQAQYPNGAPPNVVASYNAMLAQYDSAIAQVNALPCDPS